MYVSCEQNHVEKRNRQCGKTTCDVKLQINKLRPSLPVSIKPKITSNMERFVLLMLSVISMASMSYQQSRQEQIDGNSLYVRFDKNEGELLELRDWNDEITANFQMITADTATAYCVDVKLEDCALANATTFTASDIVTSDPEPFNGDVRFLVYIDLEGMDTDPADTSVLPKATLKTILDQSRLEYNSNLGTETYNITLMFVDGERVAAPIDNTINYIMIVVSILILLSACCLALVLKCKENMEQKKKLNQYENDRPATRSTNDATEHVTLTTIKPSDDDGKEASEGPVKV